MRDEPPRARPALAPQLRRLAPHLRALAPLALATLAALTLAERALRPPPARDESAPAQEFSEARARRTVEALVQAGVRETGSEAARRAEQHLVAALRALPDLEVRVLEHEGAAPDAMVPHRTVAWRTRSVLARRPGTTDGAVLLSAHYDSPPGGPGAADNAAGVAAALEALRALTAGPRLAHAVVVAFVDGEEVDLAGARGVRSDPWFAPVRAVVNLDAGGSGGRAVLLRLERPSARLLRAYAEGNAAPLASAPIEALFRRELLPTVVSDARIYRDAGLPVLELMLFEDAYAYHTALDLPARLEPGALQHLGATTLGAVRSLAREPLPTPAAWRDDEQLFADVAGRWLLRGPRSLARGLAALACLGAAALLARALRRTPPRAALGALARTLLAWLAAPLAAGLAGASLALFGAAHRWYARPARAAALAALLAALVAHLLSRPNDPAAAPRAHGAPPSPALLAQLALALLGTALAALAAPSLLAYPLLALLGLALAAALPPRAPAALVAFAPVALLTAQLADGVLRYAFVLVGHAPTPFFLDAPLLALTALLAAPLATLGPATAPALGAPPLRRLVRAGLALGAAGAYASVLAAPGYTATRPKRLLVEHYDDGRAPVLYVRAQDALAPDATLRAATAPNLRAFRSVGRSMSVAFEASLATASVAAPPSELAPATLEVLAQRRHDDGSRSVRVRVGPGGTTRLQLRLPREGLRGWSLPTPLPRLPSDAAHFVLEHMGAGPEGFELTLELVAAPVRVTVVRLSTAPEASAALRATRAALPPWAHALSYVSRVSEVDL